MFLWIEWGAATGFKRRTAVFTAPVDPTWDCKCHKRVGGSENEESRKNAVGPTEKLQKSHKSHAALHATLYMHTCNVNYYAMTWKVKKPHVPSCFLQTLDTCRERIFWGYFLYSLRYVFFPRQHSYLLEAS